MGAVAVTQPDTVNVPAVGAVRKRYVYVAVVVLVAVLGYAYLRRRSSGSAEVLYDPSTGSVTGGAGYVNPDPQATQSGDPIIVDDSVIRTDAQWSQRVYDKLVGTGGWEGHFVAVALGKYFGGELLTVQEVEVIRAGIGLEGPAPSNPPIRMAVSTPIGDPPPVLVPMPPGRQRPAPNGPVVQPPPPTRERT